VAAPGRAQPGREIRAGEYSEQQEQRLRMSMLKKFMRQKRQFALEASSRWIVTTKKPSRLANFLPAHDLHGARDGAQLIKFVFCASSLRAAAVPAQSAGVKARVR